MPLLHQTTKVQQKCFTERKRRSIKLIRKSKIKTQQITSPAVSNLSQPQSDEDISYIDEDKLYDNDLFFDTREMGELEVNGVEENKFEVYGVNEVDGIGDDDNLVDGVDDDGALGVDDEVFLRDAEDDSDETDDSYSESDSQITMTINMEEYLLEVENDQLFPTQKSIRVVLKALPKKLWNGKQGTISHSCEVSDLSKKKRRMVRRTLMSVSNQLVNGRQYSGHYFYHQGKKETLLDRAGICQGGRHCDIALSAMQVVFEHGGDIVPGLANRNGDRYSRSDTKKYNGKRVKGYVLNDSRWVHPFARSA